MKSLFIASDGKLMAADVPEHFRGGHFLIPELLPVTADVKWNEFQPYARVHTFEWRGTVARKDGSPLIDLFEEV